MNVPAEVTGSLPALLDFFKNSLVDALEARTGALMLRQLGRVLAPFFPVLSKDDQRELAVRVERLEALTTGFSREIEWYKTSDYNAQVPSDDLIEPALQDFVAGAFVAAMESPSAEKRDLFGRLIAQRLHCKTESSEDLYLRQAFIIARRCSERYLHLLATISLVNDPPRPQGNPTRTEVYEWLDANEFPLLEHVDDAACDTDDLRYLASIGALVYTEATDYLSVGTSHAPGVEQMINAVTREPFLPIPGVKVGLRPRLRP